MRIGVTEVFVDDQDKARRFYTEVLGFQLKTDAAYSESARWLTVVSPEDPDGTELLLAPLNEAAAALQQARRESGTPAVSLTSTDCRRDCEELKARGAIFRLSRAPWAMAGPTPSSTTAAGTSSTCTRTDPRQAPTDPPGRLRPPGEQLLWWRGVPQRGVDEHGRQGLVLLAEDDDRQMKREDGRDRRA